MTVQQSIIAQQYQGIAPNRVIHAVEKAAAKTGTDFSFLMEKASTESSFNPAAKAKNSSATGLFQFIENTWLTMVKNYGEKFGLGDYAAQIEMKNGKPCVANCDVKAEILNLRKNPEISALMAGAFSAENKQYLEKNTDAEIGTTELYLAHFLGANGAAKFLNAKENNGDTAASHLFPREARANRTIFFDQATGHARSLNEIYARFDNKFNNDDGTIPRPVTPSPSPVTAARSTTAPLQSPSLTPLMIAEALPSSPALYSKDDIIWNDSSDTTRSGFGAARQFTQDSLMALIQTQQQKMIYNA